jgi:hypothetical protein
MRRKLLQSGIFISWAFLIPLYSFAQVITGSGSGGTPGSGSGGMSGSGGAGSQNGGGSGIQLQNPLKSTSLMGLLNTILDVIMVFAVPLIVFFIIYAGFMYVTAQGNPGKIETANRALLYAVIGGVIILGAKVLLAVISGTVDSLAA